MFAYLPKKIWQDFAFFTQIFLNTYQRKFGKILRFFDPNMFAYLPKKIWQDFAFFDPNILCIFPKEYLTRCSIFWPKYFCILDQKFAFLSHPQISKIRSLFFLPFHRPSPTYDDAMIGPVDITMVHGERSRRTSSPGGVRLSQQQQQQQQPNKVLPPHRPRATTEVGRR